MGEGEGGAIDLNFSDSFFSLFPVALSARPLRGLNVDGSNNGQHSLWPWAPGPQWDC